MSKLDGKSVVITGASSGIGAFLAREMARRGARVGLLARRSDRLEQLAQEIRAAGATAAWAAADVMDGEGLEAALDSLERELGVVDVLVANAGFNRPETPRQHKPGRALKVYDVNLLGVVRAIDWALPRFVARRGGQIVAVASLASYLGMPANAAYCGSKAALRIHLQSLRVSLKRYGVAVTTLCPGFVESELTENSEVPMPFLWPTDRAARYMADAIEKRRGEVAFPWQMRWLVAHLGARLLPRAVTEWLMARGA